MPDSDSKKFEDILRVIGKLKYSQARSDTDTVFT